MSLSSENIAKFNVINSFMHSEKANKSNEEVKSHTTTDLDTMLIQPNNYGIEFIPHEHNKQKVILLLTLEF